MCGRFVQFSSLRTLETNFPFQEIRVAPQPNYNIAPTQPIAVVIREDCGYLDVLNWGLVPFWAKEVSMAARMINARSETIAQKPSFRAAFKKRRCLILADGFFEWTGKKGQKQPWFLRLPSRQPFAFAGIYEAWKPSAASDTGPVHRSAAIITTAASTAIKDIHHRMPVILTKSAYDRWLDPTLQDTAELTTIMAQACVTEFEFYPVATMVNRISNNNSQCIQPIDRDSPRG